jgi:hypothetical protein
MMVARECRECRDDREYREKRTRAGFVQVNLQVMPEPIGKKGRKNHWKFIR